MKIVSIRKPFTMGLAWNGEGRNDPGAVEAVIEFGPGCVIEPILGYGNDSRQNGPFGLQA
jgi:hypothetical protein